MNRVFVIGDTHFGHKKVTEFRPWLTVFEHDRALVERWNAVVKKYDTVWHLGDVFFGGRERGDILASLNGYKNLVLGNHDQYPLEVYRRYFHNIVGAVELKGCILTHIPVHQSQFPRYDFNVHGHTHHTVLADPRYIGVSAELTNYYPMELRLLINIHRDLIEHQRRKHEDIDDVKPGSFAVGDYVDGAAGRPS